MADERAGGEAIPVLEQPAEGMDERTESERGVGHAAGDDDIGALIERFGDPGRAHVGVSGHHAISRVQQSAAGLPLTQSLDGEGACEIVALDDGDTDRRTSGLLGDGEDALGRGPRVSRTEVADDLDPVLDARAQDGADEPFKRRVVAAGGIALPLDLCEGQRPFRQGLEDQEAWTVPLGKGSDTPTISRLPSACKIGPIGSDQ
jgi:hypothetical protein